MKSSDTAVTPCWHCGNENDAAVDLEGEATPKPGDVSICIQCSAPAIFTEDLGTREPTEAEIDMIMQDEGALMHMLTIAMMHGRLLVLPIQFSPDDDSPVV